MRYFKTLLVAAVLTGLLLPSFAVADASDVPGSSTWYFHLDLEQMRTADAGKGIYAWLREEVFVEVSAEAGIDLEKELDQITAYSLQGEGPVIVFNGEISQTTKDMAMAFIASGGDLDPLKSSGKTYFHLRREDGDANSDTDDDSTSFSSGNINIEFDSLGEEAWISLAIKDALLITSSEAQMKALLANKGRIAGSRSHDGTIVVLTADKTLLQAGMNSDVLADDGDSGWNSNILRNTEQVAFLLAAAADKLAIEIKLVTTEPEMAQTLASIVRGLISLSSFSDEIDDDMAAVMRGTKVNANGSNLSISLAVDPNLVVATLSD